MITNIKRYSNIINLLKNGVFRQMKGDDSWNKLHYSKVVYFNDKLYEFHTTMRFDVFLNKNIICEEGSDGNIYIGPELGNGFFKSYTETDIDRFVTFRTFGSAPNKFSDIKKDMDIKYEDYEKNPMIVQKSKPYLKIKDALNDITYDKLDVRLRDGEFPKLKNRKMLPVFIINTNTNRIDYFMTTYVDSYRKNRDSRGIDAAWIFSDLFISDYVSIPKGLVDIKINSPFVLNR